MGLRREQAEASRAKKRSEQVCPSEGSKPASALAAIDRHHHSHAGRTTPMRSDSSPSLTSDPEVQPAAPVNRPDQNKNENENNSSNKKGCSTNAVWLGVHRVQIARVSCADPPVPLFFSARLALSWALRDKKNWTCDCTQAGDRAYIRFMLGTHLVVFRFAPDRSVLLELQAACLNGRTHPLSWLGVQTHDAAMQGRALIRMPPMMSFIAER